MKQCMHSAHCLKCGAYDEYGSSRLAPLAIICRGFDHHSALHLVSLLPASPKAQDDFHHSGCMEPAYNLFSRKSDAQALLSPSSGSESSSLVICLGYEGLRERRTEAVCSVCTLSGSSRVLCIWYF